MKTTFDLLASGAAPFLVNVDHRAQIEAIPNAIQFIDEAVSESAISNTCTTRKYGNDAPVKFIRIEGRGNLYCAVAGNRNIEKLRLTYRLPEPQGQGRLLTISMPYPNTGGMTNDKLDKVVSDVLACAKDALLIADQIDLNQSNQLFESVMRACHAYASTNLEACPEAYSSTIGLRTPFEQACATFKATEDEFRLLNSIGPSLSIDMLVRNTEDGSITLSLKRTSRAYGANGPYDPIERMSALAFIHSKTVVGKSS